MNKETREYTNTYFKGTSRTLKVTDKYKHTDEVAVYKIKNTQQIY